MFNFYKKLASGFKRKEIATISSSDGYSFKNNSYITRADIFNLLDETNIKLDVKTNLPIYNFEATQHEKQLVIALWAGTTKSLINDLQEEDRKMINNIHISNNYINFQKYTAIIMLAYRLDMKVIEKINHDPNISNGIREISEEYFKLLINKKYNIIDLAYNFIYTRCFAVCFNDDRLLTANKQLSNLLNLK